MSYQDLGRNQKLVFDAVEERLKPKAWFRGVCLNNFPSEDECVDDFQGSVSLVEFETAMYDDPNFHLDPSVKTIELQDWNNLVRTTYGRPYHLQQQDGCVDRGLRRFTVPGTAKDFENDTIPEEINGKKMGVSFSAWKSRDPEAPVGDHADRTAIRLFWDRNFYPELQTVANDLHERGVLPAGDYAIDIDW